MMTIRPAVLDQQLGSSCLPVTCNDTVCAPLNHSMEASAAATAAAAAAAGAAYTWRVCIGGARWPYAV